MDPVLPEGCPSPILQPGEITQAEQDASAALAIIMCILSSLGSLLIILSYVLIKSVRTKAREILVHISVMDLTYSVANLIGAAVDFDTRMRLDPQNAYLRNACTTDGWFAIYGTTGSVLWTIGLAIYLYFKVITIRLHPRSQMMRALTVGLYLVGYILPLFIAMYFYALGLLGSNKFLSSGWCTVDVFDSKTQERFILPYLIGYDMWMYMAIILIPLLVIATKYQIDSESNKKKVGTSPIVPVVKSSWKSVEMKLMAIPVIFLLLRIWSICTGIIFIYSDAYCWVDPAAIKALYYLSGVGDSGQGFFNGILFVILTKNVRETFFMKILALCSLKPRSKGRLLLADTKYHKGPVGPPSSNVP